MGRATAPPSRPRIRDHPGRGPRFQPVLERGFNLIGNSLDITLPVVSIYGNQDAPVEGEPAHPRDLEMERGLRRWAFYSPQLAAAGMRAYIGPPATTSCSPPSTGRGLLGECERSRDAAGADGPEFTWAR